MFLEVKIFISLLYRIYKSSWGIFQVVNGNSVKSVWDHANMTNKSVSWQILSVCWCKIYQVAMRITFQKIEQKLWTVTNHGKYMMRMCAYQMAKMYLVFELWWRAPVIWYPTHLVASIESIQEEGAAPDVLLCTEWSSFPGWSNGARDSRFRSVVTVRYGVLQPWPGLGCP